MANPAIPRDETGKMSLPCPFYTTLTGLGGLTHTVYSLCLLIILSLHTGSAFSETKPVLAIKANGLVNQINISPQTRLSIKLDIAPGTYSGTVADWWVAAKTASGQWFSWVYPTGWIGVGNNVNRLIATYQGPLFAFDSFEILNVSGLAAGEYTLYFAIDTKANRVLDYDSLLYNSINVSVSSYSNTSCGETPLSSSYTGQCVSSTDPLCRSKQITKWLAALSEWTKCSSSGASNGTPQDFSANSDYCIVNGVHDPRCANYDGVLR